MKLSDFELVAQTSQEDEGSFRYAGCENTDCPSYGLGNTVYDCAGYRTLAEAQADPEGNKYEFRLCFECLYAHEYGTFPETRRM